MIAFVRGRAEEKFAGSVALEVGGVGYEVLLTDTEFEKIVVGDEYKVYTYHHLTETREELYGFFSLAAKRAFEMLITVQGVGPKAGLAIMNLGELETVRNAIANADSAFIGQAKGIGKKTAEKVIIDLSDKVGAPKVYDKTVKNDAEIVGDDALDALVALGFSLAEATDALASVDKNLPVDARIKLALRK